MAQRSGDPLAVVDEWALATPGKLVRPVLLLESAAAVGGSWEQVLPAALGLELAHVGSLLHDDIIDGDDLRRGRAAVHRQFGDELAILAGDGLLFASFEQIARCGERGVAAEAVRRACGLMAAAGRDLAAGVALELAFTGAARERRGESVLADYVEMVRLKTAALLRCACEIGAVLGGGGVGEVRALAAYGQALGIAFQIRDDLLPYTSTVAREGKPDDSDRRNDRPSLPLILVGVLGGAAARTRLSALVEDDSVGGRERLTKLLEETGALERAQMVAREYALTGHAALDEIPAGAHREVLRDLIGVVAGTLCASRPAGMAW
ncbi:polyprenyl synthetase family protein [Streptomyces sp. NPDC002580]|uniref:polyprenyl synthetase family protein n=1 Tax=Streptomyces sp. NPDC002580 TaxID=3364653 RepID=UPI003698AF29